jgi:hypothetical protein
MAKNQTNDTNLIRQRFDKLHGEMKRAEGELSRTNLAKIDAENLVKRLDAEIGEGKVRLDDLIEAKDRLEAVTDERNRASEAFQTARDQFESYKSEVSGDLFTAAVSMFEEIAPLHEELKKRVRSWREFVGFLTTHFISRKTRKLVGFRPGQSSILPTSIFSPEDGEAVETLKLFISGTLEPEITKLDDSDGRVRLRQKKVQAL